MIYSRPNESLEAHIELLIAQYELLNKYKNIKTIIKTIINKLCKENKYLLGCEEIIYDLFINYLKLHDEGKKNPFFQSYISNKEYDTYKFNKINKHHSEISSIYYCIAMYEKHIKNNIKGGLLEKRYIQEYLKDLIVVFAYNIYRHHSNLENLDKVKFIGNLTLYYENNKEQFINIDISNINNLYKFKPSNISYSNPHTYYFFIKYTYSILITCDFMSVYSHNNKENLKINVLDDKLRKECYERFNNNEIIKNIRNYKNIKMAELNKYRSEMFLESEDNILKNINNNIFYLEAPTGSGKSLTSLNLVLQLLDNTYDKLYYISPLNNLAEQTHEVIKSTFYDKAVLVNSRESIYTDEDSDNYDKDFINSQMINYPLSLISHVGFFDMIFSNHRIKNLMLSTLCNSVIIIDEVQSYKNTIWQHMINTLKEVSKMLNLKIIIMSATLPKMDKLLEDKDYKICELIKRKEYYYNYFKTRVDYDFSLLSNKKNTINELLTYINKNIKMTNRHRILIECLTTKSADIMYEELLSYKKQGFLIFKMTGSTNKKTRQHIIKTIQIKHNEEYINGKIILVGTQCIEAGIDIDMNLGFKDISILDADEQFCGRIERNFKNKGLVVFFDLDDGDFIYKSDYRTERNLQNKEYQDIFINKEFYKFYDKNYRWLLEKEYKKYTEYKSNLHNLQFEKIKTTMSLIDSNTYNFLFLCQYEDRKNSKDILNQYLALKNENIKYSEKEIKLSIIKKELNEYIYSINSFKFKNEIYNEKVSNMYVVEDGYKYFDNLTNENKLKIDSTLNINDFIMDIDLFI